MRLDELKKEIYEDKIKGGRADKKQPGDFDQKELKMGIKVEMEHTDDPEEAKKIALDHLAEFGDYYTALAAMENKLRSEQRGKAEEEKDVMGSPPGAGGTEQITKPDITRPRVTL